MARSQQLPYSDSEYDPLRSEQDEYDRFLNPPGVRFDDPAPPSEGEMYIWPGYDTPPVDQRPYPTEDQLGAQPVNYAPASSGYQAPSTSGPAPVTVQSAANAALLQLLQTNQNIDPAAINSSPAMRAYQLRAQKTEERERARLAEQATAEGWMDSGAWDTTLHGLAAERGQGEAGYAGQLSLIQMEDAKERLLAGLQFALNQGDNAAARDLQMQIANLNAQIQRERLGFDYTALQAQAQRDAALALLAGG